jgi:hypothetical protein
MIRDTFFNGSRFMNLLWKEIKENWKTYAVFTTAMFGIMMIIYLVIDSMRNYAPASNNSISQLLFTILLFIFGSISASAIMDKMKTKTGRTAFLLLPATSFEKFFTRWLIHTVAFLAIYYIIFTLADYTYAAIYSWHHPDYPVAINPRYIFLRGQGGMPFPVLTNLMAAYVYVQSFFVLGGTVCPKKSFLKTFVAGLVLLSIYLFTISVCNKSITAFYTGPYLLSIILFLMAVLNWTIAYYRFKESEIIHRLV